MKNLVDRVAVVTGAASGIGRATSIELARNGCHLAISDIDEAGLRETADEITAIGRPVSSKILDVSERDAMLHYPEEVLSEFGHVHLVFNNAGIAASDLFVDGHLADFQRLIDINLWGVVLGSKAFLPCLLREDEGHLVNMSSIFGLAGVPAQSYYCTSKFAVRGFTDSIRAEHGDSNVRFSVVIPGGVSSNIAANAIFRRGFDDRTREEGIEEFAELAKTTPEKAAEIIVRGIRKNKVRILVGRDAVMVDWLTRLAPTRYVPLIVSWFYKERD